MDVVVHVLVAFKHMAIATLFWQACMNCDYSPEEEQSQEKVRVTRF
jgi:cytochrome c oxidase assembly factor CtaG